jgi:hypothetical protein
MNVDAIFNGAVFNTHDAVAALVMLSLIEPGHMAVAASQYAVAACQHMCHTVRHPQDHTGPMGYTGMSATNGARAVSATPSQHIVVF